MIVGDTNPSDSSLLFDEEMDIEALDALQGEGDTSFMVLAVCRSCLQTRRISFHHLCESCQKVDDITHGALGDLVAN